MGLMKSTCSRLEKLKEKRKLVQENIIWAKAICPSVDISFSECRQDWCVQIRDHLFLLVRGWWGRGHHGSSFTPTPCGALEPFRSSFFWCPGMWLLPAHRSQFHIFRQASKYNFKTILFPASCSVLLIFPPMSAPQRQRGCCVLIIWSPELSIS